MSRVKKVVEHRMDTFVVASGDSETGKGDFGIKGINPRDYTIRAAALYYTLHKGEEVFLPFSNYKDIAGDSHVKGAVCVDARIPAGKGIAKTFAGLITLHEYMGGELEGKGEEKEDQRERRERPLMVVGHTDCGYMKLSLSTNLWIRAYMEERGRGPSLEELVSFVEKGEGKGLYAPLKETVERLKEVNGNVGEGLMPFIEDMLDRKMVVLDGREDGDRLRPSFPLLAAHLPILLEKKGDGELLFLYTIEKVLLHAVALRARGVEAEPYLYITESERVAKIEGYGNLVVYRNLETVEKVEMGEKGQPLGTIAFNDLLDRPLYDDEINDLLGMYE